MTHTAIAAVERLVEQFGIDAVLSRLERLWGYDVSLTTADARAAD